MTDDILIRRASEESVAARNSHGAEWGVRAAAAPRNAMGANVTIQKNWQELIRPNKLQVSAGTDSKKKRPSLPSRWKGGLASRWEMRCDAFYCRRCKAPRCNRFTLTACCMSSRRFQAFART